ncbi:DUF2795 domain-containing protein [Phytoactinopolyspora halotolerans]|uniref:DUF2795 domain-containing protein n=1 Tax=Phytoactinopolyspora halotolerans TaxID=1981512 RepID=A0A6L9SGC5_9ACTN|nr:DUF2795 domain-containing protein [Phytoactinopolyspora halotolerans]NEE04193.1 DUF2795 domain-containing protein [Phytoactinopolyspora halotolerans]
MTVSRIEIADIVEGVFADPPVDKDQLLAWAHANGARDEVIDTLRRLPDQHYRSLRDLWPHLAGVPVEL